MNYFIHTYGCQMNIHDSEKIAGILAEMGYAACDTFEKADIIVFNTCCIRETAEQKIYGHIGQVKKLKNINPQLIVAVCGCMSQKEGEAERLRRSFPFIDIILGTSNMQLLKSAVESVRVNRLKFSDTNFIGEEEEAFPVNRTSYPNAWININYGCNNFCTYCIVPYVRGRERSRKMDSVTDEVKKLLDEGYREITFLGQNVNSYGKDLNDGSNFAALLRKTASLSGKFRLRFMTSHPKDFTDDVIEAVAENPKICNCIHLPVQSGSTEILRAMNRRYTRDDYLYLTEKIRTAIPDAAITTDIMVGFPGETEKDFLDTLDLVKRVRFSSAFCFIYSARKGTPAYSMEQIPYAVKRRRISRLLETQNVITREISKEMQGNTYEILAEDVNAKYPDTYCGRTESGRLVNFVSDDKNIIGKFVKTEIETSRSATLWGRVVTED